MLTHAHPRPIARRAALTALGALASLALTLAATACTVERAPEPAPTARAARREPLPPPPPLPPELEARRVAAVERLRQGDTAEGLAELVALTREAPTPSYQLANDRSVALGLQGDWPAALAAAEEARAIHPGPEAGANQVEALLQLGDRKKADAIARALVAQHPDAAAAHYALGASRLAHGDYEGARLAFDSALDKDPDDFPAALGVLACAASDPTAPELDELGQELLARSPEDPHVLYLLGAAQETRLDPDAAKALYRRAIAAAAARGRPHPWAHWNLAHLLEAHVDLAAARPHYQAFLETAPARAKNERAEAEKKLAQKR